MVLHQMATVLPGGRLEIVNEDLKQGQTVEVALPEPTDRRHLPIIGILNSGPGQRMLKAADEVRACLASEKASWGR